MGRCSLNNTAIRFGAVALSAVLCCSAPGQTTGDIYAPFISTVDPGVSDLSPLGTSLIRNQPDLRSVRTFDSIYRVPGRSDLLMRQSGALSAVFARSEYTVTDDGVMILVPAGTVFYIGSGPDSGSDSSQGSQPAPHDTGRMGTGPVGVIQGARVTTRLSGASSVVAGDTSQASEQPIQSGQTHSSITISSESYRRMRLKRIARELRDAQRTRQEPSL